MNRFLAILLTSCIILPSFANATTKFMEPGGDATYDNSLWDTVNSTAFTVVTDFVHGTHIKSFKHAPSTNQVAISKNTALLDAGGRLSFYIYFSALPSANAEIGGLNSGSSRANPFRITTAGKLQMWNGTLAQIGIDGTHIFNTGQWYRISIAYTKTDTTHDRFEVFVNGESDISITNATISANPMTTVWLGSLSTDAALDFRWSDIYTDDSTTLIDTGDVWVTAKRPNANGTTNGFTGSGAGSGYGTGNSIYVNERALSTGSLVSKIGAGSAVTEEYNIENKTTGDINIDTLFTTGSTIIDTEAWAYMSSLASETVQFILNGVSTAQAITSTNTMYTKFAGSTTYPAGTGADVGITTDTSLTTVSLFETGVIVAFIPGPKPSSWFNILNGNMSVMNGWFYIP